ncbi:Internalin-J [Kordia antarctica]|uniref:Internalin-J n=1 Tax=Kordia antarctica TaxID=1218801 RepID=A0A7L4ZKX2_9FLAO|nr:T9SS type A sorting domain-containing protein [Kordia antarctica]QHI37117.1 Internalin-J [Kordia antarctica]
MKHFHLLCAFLLCTYISHSQIVNIGDPSLKSELIADGVDTNNDGEIQLSEAAAVTILNVTNNYARTFQGIEQFTNLIELHIGSGTSLIGTDSENLDIRKLIHLEELYLRSFSGEVNLSDLSSLRIVDTNLSFGSAGDFNLTGLTNLEKFSNGVFNSNNSEFYLNHLINLTELQLDGHGLTHLDVGNLINLQMLSFANNQITNIDLSNLTNLTQFVCFQNQLTSLDLSNANVIGSLTLANNPLTTLNIKDGIINTFGNNPFNNTNIQSICCDASELTDVQTEVMNAGYTGVTFETNCAPTPSTPYYTIQGKNTLDTNLDGCDAGDGFLSSVKYTISNGTDTATIYTDKFGNYEFIGKTGTYTITPSVPNTSYYSFSSASVTVNLPADGTTVVHDFCIMPNGPPIVTTLPLQLKNDLISQTNIDTNNDGEIQITEAESVTSLTINSPIIKGLGDFINLETLNCTSSIYSNNPVLYLDVTPLSNLKNLYCSGNSLATIDVSQNLLLERLECAANKLTGLLLQNNVNLKRLVCGNFTSSLPVNNIFDANDNSFKTLDVSANTLLEYLSCSYVTLDSLQLGSNTNLTTLLCTNSNLTTLDVTQLPNLVTLYCGTRTVTPYAEGVYIPASVPNQLTVLDVSQNPMLQILSCSENLLTTLNTTGNTGLQTLICNGNLLSALNISQNTQLYTLQCNANDITSLDVSLQSNLIRLNCTNNLLTTIDVTQNPNLSYLDCSNNQITQSFVKNGNTFITTVTEDFSVFYEFKYYGNPMEYICADDFEIDEINTRMPSNINAAVNTYCSFTPGGSYNTIEGTVRYDANGNGCDVSDNAYQYLNLNLTNSTNETSTVATKNDGTYSFHFSDDGVYTLTPELENPSYFTVSPASVTIDFPTDTSPFTQNFCITPNGIHNDIDVTLLPVNVARPGFESNYKIVYKNKGSTTLSGAINLMFEDDVMDFVTSNPTIATQALNSLQWNYTNLAPFESREIVFTMNLNSPTDSFPLNADDVLAFEATISPVIADETMEDNTFVLSQIVVNSFDPNDKTCLQGIQVTTDFIGKYVDYIIRFENTGTANAINVVVKDVIDISMFDPTTLIVTEASHAVATKITNTNTVEFIFENINLPFNDASNDGYVTFKMKTLPTLVENDTFENEAEIYFDYNFPITTNRSITLIKNTLSTTNFELDSFEIYPNPVEDVLVIKTKETIETISIYDIAGRLIQQNSYSGTQNSIEISTRKFTQGTYFVKIKTASGATLVKKIVKA